MKRSLKYREFIPDVRRVIVKIGSRVLVKSSGKPENLRIKGLCAELAVLRKAGFEIIIVTSGAVGAGMEALQMKGRPTKLPDLQMAAAVGQPRLMCRYSDLFMKCGCRVGQVLLTHDDFHHKIRMSNIRRTMENLLRHGVIPIVNENDVVADEEIRAQLALGDNDYLASLLARLIRADLLIMLTTVDGVRERSASGTSARMRYIESINRRTYAQVSGERSALSKGGMATKLKAAHSASRAGCSTVIADGRRSGVLKGIMNGEDVGTLVLAMGTLGD
jgi:glutamate 5-kinase